MNELLFDVKKVETQSLLGSDFKIASGISHAIVGKGDKILHFCSEGYGLVPNRQIYEEFVGYFEEHNIAFDATGINFRDSRFKMNFALTDYPIDMGGGDILFPAIGILNSYNGYQKYQFEVGIWRKVCSNGLSILVDGETIKMLHTPQVTEGMAVEKSIDLLTNFLELYDDAIEPFEELQDFPVHDVPARIQEVVEATKFPVGLLQLSIDRALQELKDYKLAPTDWLVYNCLNYQLNHHVDNLVGRKASAIDKEVLQYLLTY